MKNKAWIIGVVSALVLSGCTNPLPEIAEIEEAPQEAELSFESTGWECFPFDGYGYCSIVTFDGASTSDLDDSVVSDVSFGFLMIFCLRDDGESLVTVSSGSSSDVWMDSAFLWNPVSYPNLTYSIDGGPKESTAYEISSPWSGEPKPQDIYLLRQWPNVMRDISSAKTLQIWLTDSTGTERQIDLDVEGSVSAVANLAAWGYSCDF